MKRACTQLVRFSSIAILMAGGFANSGVAWAQAGQDPRAETRQDPPAQEREGERDNRNANDDQLVRLPEGTVITVRLADDVNSNKEKMGAMITGTVDPSVLIHDTVVVPRGTEAHIQVTEAKKGGHIKGKAEVRLELTSLIMNGQRLGVDSNKPGKEKGAAEAKSSAAIKKGEKTSGASAAAPEGAAAGPVIAAFSAAKVEVKAGSKIEFKLESPFTFEKPPVTTSESQ